MMSPITVILTDDHAVVRESLAQALTNEPDIQPLGTFDNADAAVEAAKQHKPSVAVMDIDMPGRSSFEAAREIIAECPGTKVMFLSAFTTDRYIEQALAAGALGYVIKAEPPSAVADAIRALSAGKSWFSKDVQDRLVFSENGLTLAEDAGGAATRSRSLTKREVEVLTHLAHGLAKKEIAALMHISVKTVDNHTTNIMTKLDIHDRVQLARHAIREGYVQP